MTTLSVREQIIQATINTITPIAKSHGAFVFRSPAIAIQKNQLPAIIVTSDKMQVKINNQICIRDLILRVSAIAQRADDASSDELVDRISTAVTAALAQSDNLNGLCQTFSETEVEYEVDEADVAIVELPVCFQACFRTKRDDPASKA
jgi:hypothetical protein